ncbi:hypothetical protein NKDENANG_04154 [Candidatus Entotheonellaceae bacterium PAL068K]
MIMINPIFGNSCRRRNVLPKIGIDDCTRLPRYDMGQCPSGGFNPVRGLGSAANAEGCRASSSWQKSGSCDIIDEDWGKGQG